MERAVLIGAGMIAAAILAGHLLAPLVAPYRFLTVVGQGMWRFNAITGEAAFCLRDDADLRAACGPAEIEALANRPRSAPK